MQFSVVLPTYNRAAELEQTLASLATVKHPGSWEVIVVDNNSRDATPQVVADAAAKFPTALRYVLETKVGRSAAMNAGITAAKGEIIVNTDDDVRFEPDWLQQAGEALTLGQCDFVGGKVLPIWRGRRPAWLSDKGGQHWAVIALLDFGPEPLEFGKRHAPLGVNLAFKREAFDRAGLWDPSLGRKAGTLLGQEVREWMLRARDAGLRGMYAPNMVVHHVIPADRLRKHYFRKWSYWHGVSRAILFQQHPIDMQAPEDTSLDFSKIRMIFGVPQYMYRSCLESAVSMAKQRFKRQQVAAFERELDLWFFLGVLRQRWKDRNKIAWTGDSV
jgi:glycosyltransferase involved in cell wall biosynthesis